MYLHAVGENETATVIASAAYKSLTSSSKEALRIDGDVDGKNMTKTEMKSRAERIGQEIQQLVKEIVYHTIACIYL